MAASFSTENWAHPFFCKVNNPATQKHWGRVFVIPIQALSPSPPRKTGEDWGQTESFLAFQQLDKLEGNILSVPEFPTPKSDDLPLTERSNFYSRVTAQSKIGDVTLG